MSGYLSRFFAVLTHHGSAFRFGQTAASNFWRHRRKVRDGPSASLVLFREVSVVVWPCLFTPEYFAFFCQEQSVHESQFGEHSAYPVSYRIFRVLDTVRQHLGHLLHCLVKLVLFKKIENL
jgi:hypothetical protein